MSDVLLRRLHRPADERGAALVMALIFLSAIGITLGALLTFTSTTSTSTGALRTARGYDYDANAAMNAAVANVRVGNTCGTGASGYTPAWTLNVPSRPVRVDCFPLSSSSTQRNDVFSVCPSSVSAPCPDASSVLRANIIFYDVGATGSSVQTVTWSNK
jgi:hypothetical protein